MPQPLASLSTSFQKLSELLQYFVLLGFPSKKQCSMGHLLRVDPLLLRSWCTCLENDLPMKNFMSWKWQAFPPLQPWGRWACGLDAGLATGCEGRGWDARGATSVWPGGAGAYVVSRPSAGAREPVSLDVGRNGEAAAGGPGRRLVRGSAAHLKPVHFQIWPKPCELTQSEDQALPVASVAWGSGQELLAGLARKAPSA